MKITQLIEELKEVLVEEGDLECIVLSDCASLEPVARLDTEFELGKLLLDY